MGDSWVIPSVTSLTERSVCILSFFPYQYYLDEYPQCYQRAISTLHQRISSPSNQEVFKQSDSKSGDVAAAIHLYISSAHVVSFLGKNTLNIKCFEQCHKATLAIQLLKYRLEVQMGFSEVAQWKKRLCICSRHAANLNFLFLSLCVCLPFKVLLSFLVTGSQLSQLFCSEELSSLP